MPGQTDDADVVTKILAAELRADPQRPGDPQHLLFKHNVAERTARPIAGRRQPVEITRAGELDGLQVLLRGKAADDDSEMIRRTGRGAERRDAIGKELRQRLGRQGGARFLIQKRFIGRAAPLGHEQEMILVARLGVDIDLRGEIGAGIGLLEHAERRHLAIAQIALGITAADALGKYREIIRSSPDLLALVAQHDGGSGVLAHGQGSACRDIRVL